MNSKIIGFLLMFLCSANALALPEVAVEANESEVNEVAPLKDYGPALKDVILEVVRNISESGPIVLIPPEVELRFNLTEILEAIIEEGQTSPLKGMMQLWGPSIILDNNVEVPHSYVNLNGILNPLNISLLLEVPRVGLGGEYEIDAILLGIIPVQGKGQFFMGLNLGAGIEAQMKVYPTPGSPITFLAFDYIFNLNSIDVKFEGLIGDGDLSDVINNVINDFIKEQVTPGIVSLEKMLRPFIDAIIHDTLNDIVKDLTYKDILAILEGLMKPKP